MSRVSAKRYVVKEPLFYIWHRIDIDGETYFFCFEVIDYETDKHGNLISYEYAFFHEEDYEAFVRYYLKTNKTINMQYEKHLLKGYYGDAV